MNLKVARFFAIFFIVILADLLLKTSGLINTASMKWIGVVEIIIAVLGIICAMVIKKYNVKDKILNTQWMQKILKERKHNDIKKKRNA